MTICISKLGSSMTVCIYTIWKSCNLLMPHPFIQKTLFMKEIFHVKPEKKEEIHFRVCGAKCEVSRG